MKKNLNPEITIYEAGDKKIEVSLNEESIWLDAHRIAYLLDVDRTVIVKHIQNIYKSLELSEELTCAKIAQVAADGKKRKMNLYNLDMIISVGYRVNSKKFQKSNTIQNLGNRRIEELPGKRICS